MFNFAETVFLTNIVLFVEAALLCRELCRRTYIVQGLDGIRRYQRRIVVYLAAHDCQTKSAGCVVVGAGGEQNPRVMSANMIDFSLAETLISHMRNGINFVEETDNGVYCAIGVFKTFRHDFDIIVSDFETHAYHQKHWRQ